MARLGKVFLAIFAILLLSQVVIMLLRPYPTNIVSKDKRKELADGVADISSNFSTRVPRFKQQSNLLFPLKQEILSGPNSSSLSLSISSSLSLSSSLFASLSSILSPSTTTTTTNTNILSPPSNSSIFTLSDSTLVKMYKDILTDPTSSTLSSNPKQCINIFLPSFNFKLNKDGILYNKHLNSKLIQGWKTFNNSLTISKADLYLEETPRETNGKHYFPSYSIKKDIWFMPHSDVITKEQFLYPEVSLVFAKSKHSLNKLLHLRKNEHFHYRIYYTKYSSADLYNPKYKQNYSQFLHISEKKKLKNTEIIMKLWLKHPKWPKLTIISKDLKILKLLKKKQLKELKKEKEKLEEKAEKQQKDKNKQNSTISKNRKEQKEEQEEHIPQNIHFIEEYLSDEKISILYNSIGIHLFPSKIEGYEYYINEARSTKALVITRNIPPLNELITNTTGFLIGKHLKEISNDIEVPLLEELEIAINKVLKLTQIEKENMGNLGRKAFLKDKEHFISSMKALNSTICGDEEQKDFFKYIYPRPDTRLEEDAEDVLLLKDSLISALNESSSSSLISNSSLSSTVSASSTTASSLKSLFSLFTFPSNSTKVPPPLEEVCVNIYLPSSSGGLSLDAKVYEKTIDSSIIKGWNPPPKDLKLSKVDLFIEQTPGKPFGPSFYNKLHQMKNHIWWMPNPEFSSGNHLFDPLVTLVFAKTEHALKNLLRIRLNFPNNNKFRIYYSKHTSLDTYLPLVEKNYNEFLHVAGTSYFKNTELILDVWYRHSEWPNITIIAQHSIITDYYKNLLTKNNISSINNVNFIQNRLSGSDLLNLQNRIGLHLCPSKVEGYGHYINEARSTKAVILTGNIAPTNELITNETGILVGGPDPYSVWGLLASPILEITDKELENGIFKILNMTLEEKIQRGELARKAFLDDQLHFNLSMKALNEAICKGSNSTEYLKYIYPKAKQVKYKRRKTE